MAGDPLSTALYIRVSTADQSLSVGAQETSGRAYVALRELGDVELYVDQVSGSTRLVQRAAGSRLAEAIEAGQVTNVVAARLDRLFRNTTDTLLTLHDWDRHGVALHLLDMGGSAVDTGSPMGRFLITMLAGMAEFERALGRERTAAALAEKRARGEYTGGAVPWGFSMADGHLFPADTEIQVAEIVEFRRAAGVTWRAIADELNAEPDHRNRGRMWRHDTLIKRIGQYQRRRSAA